MRYSQFRNAIERTSGHLWQSRYYSCAVDPAQLAVVMRYVELNPVRAGMVARAQEYDWSSARAHAMGDRSGQGMELVTFTDWDRCWTAGEWAAILESGSDGAAEIREATYRGASAGICGVCGGTRTVPWEATNSGSTRASTKNRRARHVGNKVRNPCAAPLC
jgi:putative transposase